MKKILLGLGALVFLLVAGIAVVFLTFDPVKYRPQLIEILSKQTGRTVTLNGPIKLSLSLYGAKLTIGDAAIGNPTWASRKEMAGIGHFDLGIALMPLLSHQLIITDLKIVNADIQLETNGDGKHNWEFTATEAAKPGVKTATASSSGKPITIEARNISIKDSQLAVRGNDGKTTIFKTKNLAYLSKSDETHIIFDGLFNEAPIKMDLQIGTNDLLANKSSPFDLILSYDIYNVKAKGKANVAAKTANISEYGVTAGNSEIHGQLAANWGGARPVLKGTLLSNGLNPDDFKSKQKESESKTAPAADNHGNSNRVFSDAPLPFDALKSVDADLDVQIASLVSGGATLSNVISKVDLQNGHLSAPTKATLGKNTMTIGLKADAAVKPPQVAFTLNAPRVDIADLLAFMHAPAFISGIADADVNVTSEGYSMHNLAYGANGTMSVIAASGNVSGSGASGIAQGLMEVLAPNGTNAMNCLAARFTITNGIAKDNGILLDSVATTVQGKGSFNLGTETLDMILLAKPKIVNIGSAIPPLKIGGSFKSPSFNLDSSALMQNVVGVLTSGSLTGITASPVPDVKGPAGQNACVYTLDHAATATAQQPAAKSGVLVPGVAGQINRIKDGGAGLLKGLLGQ